MKMFKMKMFSSQSTTLCQVSPRRHVSGPKQWLMSPKFAVQQRALALLDTHFLPFLKPDI